MRRPVLRESFFVAWSAVIVALVAAGPITDGGASSPLIAGLFLPLVFAALSYPLPSMVAVGAMVVGTYLAIALGMGGVDTPQVGFVSLALTCATWMCAWQARNHDLQRRELGRVSRSDPLTGCLNRRGFEERFAGELSRAVRAGGTLADRDGLHQHADLALYAVKRARNTEAPGAGVRELSWAAALARAVDVRMAGAHGHSGAVADLAARMGAALNWGPERVGRLRVAAMLHDVGKLTVPEELLRKPARLTDDEMAIVRTHADAGAEIAARIEGMEAIGPWIRHSHEHVDGSGYPRGLRGEDIPVESRILLVADAFDAMTSDRAYRAAMPVADALAELHRCAGRQFDARCVELLCAALALGGEGAGTLDHVVALA